MDGVLEKIETLCQDRSLLEILSKVEKGERRRAMANAWSTRNGYEIKTPFKLPIKSGP